MIKSTMLTLSLLTMTNIFYASENTLQQQYQETKARRAEICEEWKKFHESWKDTEGNYRISNAQQYELYGVKQDPYPYNFYRGEQFIETSFKEFRDSQDNKWLEHIAFFLQNYEKAMKTCDNKVKICRSMFATMLQTNKK